MESEKNEIGTQLKKHCKYIPKGKNLQMLPFLYVIFSEYQALVSVILENDFENFINFFKSVWNLSENEELCNIEAKNIFVQSFLSNCFRIFNENLFKIVNCFWYSSKNLKNKKFVFQFISNKNKNSIEKLVNTYKKVQGTFVTSGTCNIGKLNDWNQYEKKCRNQILNGNYLEDLNLDKKISLFIFEDVQCCGIGNWYNDIKDRQKVLFKINPQMNCKCFETENELENLYKSINDSKISKKSKNS